jgi:glycosyltransferase involved in cell wall biosynthesis
MAKRIALVSDHASPLAVLGGVDSGGQNVYVAQVARQLAARGHQVDVFTRRNRTALPRIVEWCRNVRVIHVPAGPATEVRKEDLLPYMGDFARWIVGFCRMQGGYDLLHANFFMSGMAALQVRQSLGTPFVITFHALGHVRRQHQRDADEFPAERTDIEERLVAEADAIVAECPQDRADLETLYNAHPSKLHVVPCGFDKEGFWPLSRRFARQTLGFSPEERVLVNVGRLVPRKGIDNVIRGLGFLKREHDLDATLLVVGGNSDVPDPHGTPEIARLGVIAAREAAGQRVIFTGRRSRELLKLYYAAADALVTTPWYEPFGITPLEAMACGTPVIGAAVGGLQYSIEDGENGFLVPPHQPRQLGNRLAHFYANPRLAKRMSRNALRRVHALFTWERVARKLEAVYATVVEPAASLPTARAWNAKGTAALEPAVAIAHGTALP